MKPQICQWCFEKPAVENSIYCQECIDSFKVQENKANEFNLEEWFEGV